MSFSISDLVSSQHLVFFIKLLEILANFLDLRLTFYNFSRRRPTGKSNFFRLNLKSISARLRSRSIWFLVPRFGPLFWTTSRIVCCKRIYKSIKSFNFSSDLLYFLEATWLLVKFTALHSDLLVFKAIRNCIDGLCPTITKSGGLFSLRQFQFCWESAS